MANKLDRFKKLYQERESGETNTNPYKEELVKDLASLRPQDITDDLEESKSNNGTDDLSINSTSSNEEYETGVQNMSIDSTDNIGVESYAPGRFSSSSVQQGIRHTLESKETKEMTHKKTSVLLHRNLLGKLENFDSMYGGRVKGLLFTSLLEGFFEEIEQDPKIKKALNKKNKYFIDGPNK